MVTLVAAVMMVIATTYAQNTQTGVNEKVINAFAKKFAQATNPSWEFTDAYFKASFQWNGQNLTSFFTKDGDLMGITRNIYSTELPINLRISLTENYSQFWISELFEYAKEGTTKYYVTIENATEKIHLESVGTYEWSAYKKASKTI